MRVGIVAQRGNERAVGVADEVAAALADRAELSVDPETASALDREPTPVVGLADCDLVVSIGGDGTFLYAARHADTTPLLGVNLGEVGFLNTVAPSDAVSAARREVDHFEREGWVRSEPLPRVTASGDGWSLTPAINEVLVQSPQRGRGHAVTMAIFVDGERYLERAVDGLLVATPAGSTAYNLSEGGPLLRPSSGVFVITPMSPSPAARPLVVPQEATVRIDVDGQPEAIVLADGSQDKRIDLPASVRVEAAEQPARIAAPGVDLFGALGKLD
jgi:NAD+ kinase